MDKDKSTSSLELIAFRLGELTKTTEKGFDSLDTRLGKMEDRIRALENWQAADLAGNSKTEKNNLSLTQIIIMVLGILGVAVGAIAQVIK